MFSHMTYFECYGNETQNVVSLTYSFRQFIRVKSKQRLQCVQVFMRIVPVLSRVKQSV